MHLLRSGQGTRSSLLLFVVFSLLILPACSRISKKDVLAGGELLLQREVRGTCYDELNLYWSTTWDDSFEAYSEPSMIPSWAAERYSTCIYWEGTFSSRREEARRGEDLILLVEGTGWGWILMNDKLESHITEVGARWTRTEDGEQTESGDQVFLEAWEEPTTDQ